MSICTSRTDTCLYMPSGWVVVHALPVSEYTDHKSRCLYRPYGWVSVQAVRVDVVRLSVCTGRTGVCPCRRLVPVYALWVSVRAVQVRSFTGRTDGYLYTPYRRVCIQTVCVHVCKGRMGGCLYMPYGWVSVLALRLGVLRDCRDACLYSPYGWVSHRLYRWVSVPPYGYMSKCPVLVGDSVRRAGQYLCRPHG